MFILVQCLYGLPEGAGSLGVVVGMFLWLESREQSESEGWATRSIRSA